MNHSGESLAQKQRRLAGDIARQRTELAQAYRNIERPIHYTEQAMRGFGFLRQNPWVLSVVPAVFSITSTVVGLIRNKPPKSALKRGRWFSRGEEREAERESKGLAGHFFKWGGRGWKLFRLYSRVRKFLP